MDQNDVVPPKTPVNLPDPETSLQPASNPCPSSLPTRRHPFCHRSLPEAKDGGESPSCLASRELESLSLLLMSGRSPVIRIERNAPGTAGSSQRQADKIAAFKLAGMRQGHFLLGAV